MGEIVDQPLLSLICPTIGRRLLKRFLQSVRDQAGPDEVEVLVIGDTYDGTWEKALEIVPALCEQYQAKYYTYDGGVHCVGHPQRQFGATLATGAWLMWSQDDNVWLPNAWESIKESLQSGPAFPHLFRVKSRFGHTVWITKGDLSVGAIDADCIAVRNEPAKLGTWALEYCGDQHFIVETIQKWGGMAQWEPDIIMDSRPGGLHPLDI